MIRRRMVSLALGLVCGGLVLAGSGHAGWAPQKAQAVSSMNSLDLPALKKPITKRFVNSKLSEVLAWLSLEQFSFVADSSEFAAESSVTLNFRNQPLGAVLDAIADAYNGRWERKGEIFMLRPQLFRTGLPLRSTMPPMSVAGEGRWTTEPAPPAQLPEKVANPSLLAPAGTTVPAPLFGPGALKARSLAPLTGTTAPGAVSQPTLPSAPSAITRSLLAPQIAERVATGRAAPLITTPVLPSRIGEAVRSVNTLPPLATTASPLIRSYAGEVAVAQDSKAHQEAMKEVERALKMAEQEMKKLHESGEWKKSMERAMAEARTAQGIHGEEHKKAMEEVRRAMAEAHKAMQNMPHSDEWKKAWEKAREEMRKALKEGKVVENGKERKMTDQERKKLEDTLKHFETMKMPLMKFDFKGLDKMDLKPLEKMNFEGLEKMKLDGMKGHTFVMPKIDTKVFAMPKDFKGRVFVMPPDDPKFKARNQEIQRHIEEMNERMKEMGIEGMKGHTFVMPKIDQKSLLIPKMKMEELKGLQGLDKIRPMMLDSRKMRISELLESLSSSQKEKQEKQGYLTLEDLTSKQREMLGNVPTDGNWTFSYSIDGKKLTIKNK